MKINEQKNSFASGKLAELLKGLSSAEYKDLGLYLNSPYFNKSEIMIRLYGIIKPYHSKNKLAELTKEKIFKELYGKKKMNEVLLRKQLSDLQKLTEDFLAINELGKNGILKKNMILQSSVRKKINSVFRKTLNDLELLYNKTTDKDSEYYEQALNTKRIKYEKEASSLVSPEENISVLSFSLDMFFLSLKLIYYYDILNLRLHYNKNIEFDMWAFDDISKFIEKNREILIKDHSAIFADYLSVLMLLHPAETEYYNNLKSFVNDNSIKLGVTSMNKMYVILYNHSVYRHNRGFAESNNELFEVIKIIEEENIPIWNYFAFHIYYVNAVTNAVRAGEFAWAEQFINQRKEKIRDDIREETNSLALANLYFTKRDYNNALKYLVNVDYPNYSYYLMAKDMQIKIYWERSETEGVFSAIDAMRKFLQRKDLIPERLHECYTNFINCVSRMAEPGLKDRKFEIGKYLEKEMISADKLWIKDNLEKLG